MAALLSSQSQLLTLPAEIRAIIYECLSFDVAPTIYEGINNSTVLWTPRQSLLETCRLTRTECLPYFLSAMRLATSLRIDEAQPNVILESTRFQSIIPYDCLSGFKKVTVDLNIACYSNFTSNLHHLPALKCLTIHSIELDPPWPAEGSTV
jgi:hypothetical protein